MLGVLNLCQGQACAEPVVPVVIIGIRPERAIVRSRVPLPRYSVAWLEWHPPKEERQLRCVTLTRIRALGGGGFEAEACTT